MVKKRCRGLRHKLDLPSHRIRQAILPRTLRARRIPRKGEPIPSGDQRRLFVDLAMISGHDAGTGIQRVVRALALALSGQAPGGWDLQFVAATRAERYHRIAWPAPPEQEKKLVPIQARPGDVFVGLDYSPDMVRWHRHQLAQFRRAGCTLWFLVHDLLPAQRPDWFSARTVVRYRAWLDILASLADGFFCNSHETEADLVAELRHYGLSPGDYRSRVLPMGYDISESIHETSSRDSASREQIRVLASQPYFLNVGTLEPRKGHIDLIRAFEVLWATGSDQILLLIGRLGWRVDDLRDAIVSHAEFGRRLIWLNDVDDAGLIEAYRGSEGVLVSSHAEGYGLPLIEALGHNKPVMARDLPIFRWHEPNGVHFFPTDATPEILAEHVIRWGAAIRAGDIVVRPPETNWGKSAQELLAAIGA